MVGIGVEVNCNLDGFVGLVLLGNIIFDINKLNIKLNFYLILNKVV